MTNEDWVDLQLNRIMRHRAEIGFPYDPAFPDYAREALTFYRVLSHLEPEPVEDLDEQIKRLFAPLKSTPDE